MLNIGIRPTVNGTMKRIEVHILDFNQTIYNTSITLKFVERLRNERKFENLEALKEQLDKDRIQVNKILHLA